MAFSLPELGYAYSALEPYIDAQTMEIHFTKHHQGYVTKLNAALEGSDLLNKTAEELVRGLGSLPADVQTAVRNNGGGHVNHSFFWPLLKKDVQFEGPVAEAITEAFGSKDAFKDAFSKAAAGVFGSGWAWLVVDSGKLAITTTPNQDSPLTQGLQPILGLDVWEHAYYIKYQNRRPEYIDAFFNVINWEHVNKHFETSK